jgi:hypothetical protein
MHPENVPDKDEVPGARWGPWRAAAMTGQLGADRLLVVELVGRVRSAGIGYHLPLRGLLRSAGAIGPTGAVDVVAVGATLALADQPVARSARRMIAQVRVVGWRAWLSLYSSTTALAPRVAYCSSRRTHWYSSAGDRGRAGRASGLCLTNTGSRVGVAGRPVRWRAASIARWRTASGLRAGIPRPWRVKALRSDSQLVPSSAAAR